MIEIVSAGRCIGCDVCVAVCPTNVFDPAPGGGPPVIARQTDCQTCFMCEAYCPVDALFVAPHACPLPTSSPLLDEEYLAASGLLGSYRNEIGWGRGRTPGARTAVGPPLPPAHITTAVGRSADPLIPEGATGA
ncbi:ferredoxin family protein [Planosporangium thailandense]|uniref:Ferredoxin family protein n=1 Tax=Planosporangium thailandense TaxID=765197 RepID=A0ABX0Y9L5_9ACTN|nr:ferredoxin family protein [Planosporangium thailandense]NJC74105.1 ferredoxin family protein [Planosporangium thailandense]